MRRIYSEKGDDATRKPYLDDIQRHGQFDDLVVFGICILTISALDGTK
jgi:hypothetical protein